MFPALLDRARHALWRVVNALVYITGDQAALKFKNMKDRWVKMVTAHDARQKSGAPGKAAEVNTKWPLFEVVNSVLKDAPCYAKN